MQSYQEEPPPEIHKGDFVRYLGGQGREMRKVIYLDDNAFRFFFDVATTYFSIQVFPDGSTYSGQYMKKGQHSLEHLAVTNQQTARRSSVKILRSVLIRFREDPFCPLIRSNGESFFRPTSVPFCPVRLFRGGDFDARRWNDAKWTWDIWGLELISWKRKPKRRLFTAGVLRKFKYN